MSKRREWYILVDMSCKWKESKWKEPKWRELLVLRFGSKGVGLTLGTCHLGFQQEGDDGDHGIIAELQLWLVGCSREAMSGKG